MGRDSISHYLVSMAARIRGPRTEGHRLTVERHKFLRPPFVRPCTLPRNSQRHAVLPRTKRRRDDQFHDERKQHDCIERTRNQHAQ
jgi:hypothetical protein